VTVACTYEVWSDISELLFWSTFMTLIAMALSMLAGVLLPYRMKSIYDVSPASQYKVGGLPAITVLGTISFLFVGGLALATALLNDQFGLFNSGPARWGLYTAVIVTLVSAIWYFGMVSYRRSEGLDLSAAFREIPPD
jgi:hypothetical protein